MFQESTEFLKENFVQYYNFILLGVQATTQMLHLGKKKQGTYFLGPIAKLFYLISPFLF